VDRKTRTKGANFRERRQREVRRIHLPKLSEKGRRSLRGSLTEHLHGTFRPILASLRLPIPRSECCSYSFSDSLSRLDFSHLSQTGWVAHRQSAQREDISSWLHTPLSDLGDKAPSSAPKGATPRVLARCPRSVSCPFGPECPVLLLVRMRGGDFSL
jgi:hypothetical protein